MIKEQLEGCLIGGAIRDAIGGFYENRSSTNVDLLAYLWYISDDTQLTLATCQAIIESAGKINVQAIAQKFYNGIIRES